MAKTKRERKDTQASHTKSSKKHKKGAVVVPVPEELAGGSGRGASPDVSDDDLQFVQQHGTRLGFLHSLPKGKMDEAVTTARTSAQKKAAAADAQRARTAQRGGRTEAPSGRNASPSDEEESASESEESAGADSDSEEGEAWERGPRRLAGARQVAAEKVQPLPVKSLTGQLIAAPEEAAPVPISAALSSIAGVTIEDDMLGVLQQQAAEKKARQLAAKAERTAAAAEAAQRQKQQAERDDEDAGGKYGEDALRSLDAYQSLEHRREDAKRCMAAAAQALLANPEGQAAKQLRLLLPLLHDTDAHVARLAMLSLLAVFQDVLPGYRIRPPAEREQEGVVVSKEVRRLWDYEAALLRGYQTYLKGLLEALNSSRSGAAPPAHGRVASRCMAALLTSAPHFNYASDLLQALVPNMASKDAQIRGHCCGAVASLAASAMSGGNYGADTAVEAVQLVADLVKRRKCVAPPEVVGSLLAMSFPEIASGEDFAAANRSRKSKSKGKKGGNRRKKDDVERAFQEAAAVADVSSRRAQQSAALEALFEVFFRVLKTATASGLVAGAGEGAPMAASRFSKRFPLLTPSLHGLAKFSHLISVDYFTDLSAALEQLLGSAALPPALRLRCLLTAAHILKGQGEALNVDRRGLHMQLYGALTRVQLAPLNEAEDAFDGEEEGEEEAGSGGAVAARRAHGSSSSNSSQQQAEEGGDDSEQGQVPSLVAQLLDSMVLGSKLLDAARQAAFAKRIAAAAAAFADSGGAMGMLCVLQRMLRRQPKLRGMLDNEAGGPASSTVFKPALEDPAEAGALSVPLWELAALALHYHPHVAHAARDISNMNVAAAAAAAAGGGTAGGSSVLPLALSPAELAAQYSTVTGGFRPAPTVPPPARKPPASSSSTAGKAAARAAAKLQADGAVTAFLAAVSAGQPNAQAAGAPASSRPGGGAFSAATTNGGCSSSSSAAAAAGRGGGGGGSMAAINRGGDVDTVMGVDAEGCSVHDAAAALLRHFRTNRMFQRNVELRREHALVAAQLRTFHAHLQKQQKQKQKQQKKAKQQKEPKQEDKSKGKRKSGPKGDKPGAAAPAGVVKVKVAKKRGKSG